MKKYLVGLVTSGGRSKSISVEAESCKNAVEIAKERYPSAEVVRTTSDKKSIDYFNSIKEMKKK